MDGLSALVVGGGSIGTWHLRLLSGAGADVSMVTSRTEAFEVTAYSGIAEALAARSFEYCVIASPTAQHARDAAALADAGFRGILMLEKPIFAATSAAAELDSFERVGVNYNLRYHPAVDWLRLQLDGREALVVDIAAQSYLPDWRSGRDYRTTSSSSSSAGGGVLRDLSHELDLALWLFGPVRSASALVGNWGELAIETETACAALLELEKAHAVTLRLSYLDRRPERRVRATTATDVLEADLLTGRCTTAAETSEHPFDWNDTYLAAHRALLAGGDVCTPAEALAVLALVEQLEAGS